nr:MAG: RNA-dependent RNA polymerase [Sjack associated botourmia-like virus 29]
MITHRQRKRGSSERLRSLELGPLTELCSVLGRIFSVRLDVPEFGEGAPLEKKVKEFCVGLLENPVNHTWWPSVRRCGVEERTSIAASLFLARKAIAFSPDPRQAEKHMALMSSPAAPSPPGFIEFVDTEIDRLFKVGWDQGYRSHVFSHTPTSSSCLEYSRKRGGARRWLAEQGQDWFSDFCLGGGPVPSLHVVKYAVVQTGGKMRGVTCASAMHHVLGPLHRTLYDHLSQFGWLLRGEARGKKFSSFQQKRGEIFVSGDYESATDNLSLEVTQHILARILRNTRCVPREVVEYAMCSLSSAILYPGGHVVQQRRGQLMGNYLSFPLLCIQNYLSFRFCIPREVPLRINGDDIVFRCRPSEFDKWKLGVGAAGLTLSAGKTLVDSAVFSLNSCFFRAGNRRVWEIPVIRLSSAVSCSDNPLGASGFTRFIRGWKGESRRLLGAMWLRYRRKHIQASGRSVEEWGIPADNSQLHTANLAVRESFFRGGKSWLRLPDCPIPPVPLQGVALLDWVRAPTARLGVNGSQVDRWQKESREEFARRVWRPGESAPSVLWNEWWEDLKRTGREDQWLAWKRTTKLVHRMGVRLNLVLRSPATRNLVKRSWIPRAEYASLARVFKGGVGFL